MQEVTAEYSENIAKTLRHTRIIGYVSMKSGTTYSLNDDNIAQGSLSITRKLNSRGDFRPGGVAAAELNVTLLGFGEIEDRFDGASIALFFDLFRSSERAEYDRVPLGVFWVDGSQTKRKHGTVKLKAYDSMMKFDAAAGALTGSLYELTEIACASCGIGLALSQEEFEALPNATMTVTIDTSRIQTWRDFLMFEALLMGCYCRMGRQGEGLEFVPLTCERVDVEVGSLIQTKRTIDADNRFSTDFSDDKIYISKLYTRHNGSTVDSSKITWTGEAITMLAQLELMENPLLRDKSADEVSNALTNSLRNMTKCALRAFSSDFNGDPALDIGDYVKLQGGSIDITQNSAGTGVENGFIRVVITSQTWRYRGKHRISCVLPTLIPAESAVAAALDAEEAEAPFFSQVKSQTEKRIDGLEARLGKDGGAATKLQTTDSSLAVTTFPNGVEYTNADGEYEGNLMFDVADEGGFQLASQYCALRVTRPEIWLYNQLYNIKFSVGSGSGITYIEVTDTSIAFRGGSGRTLRIDLESGEIAINERYTDKDCTLSFKNGELYVGGKRVLTEE